MASAQRWKEEERECARLLGGRRLPNNGFGQPDVMVDGTLAVQVKVHKTLPQWFKDHVTQSQRDAEGLSETGILWLAERAGRGIPTQRYVVMPAAVFMELTGSSRNT